LCRIWTILFSFPFHSSKEELKSSGMISAQDPWLVYHNKSVSPGCTHYQVDREWKGKVRKRVTGGWQVQCTTLVSYLNISHWLMNKWYIKSLTHHVPLRSPKNHTFGVYLFIHSCCKLVYVSTYHEEIHMFKESPSP
jgi:hypothetical protein